MSDGKWSRGDRERDQLFARAGWRTLRFTHRPDRQARPEVVAATLRAVL